MERRDEKALTRNFKRLVDETPVQLVTQYLHQQGILSSEHVEEILTQNTEKNRARTLISTLTRRGPKAFSCFVEALKKAGHNSLAERLECD